MTAGRQGERNAVELLHAAVLGHHHSRQCQLLAERRRRPVGDRLQLRRHHALGLELVDHLLVLDLHVLTSLIPVDQFLDRRRQILVGEQDSHDGTDIHLAGNGEVAADQIDREWRRL